MSSRHTAHGGQKVKSAFSLAIHPFFDGSAKYSHCHHADFENLYSRVNNCSNTVKNPQFDNLSCGVPGKADSIGEREGYALGYIEKHEQPAWVQYIMTSEEVSRRAAKRGDDFRPDPEIPTGSATPQDYTRSGYDRGHLAPAADMSFSAKAMSESFFMSNMSPQAPQFNRGIWSKLEKQVRHFATKEKRIVVVTGPVLPAEKTITIGANKVTVPQYYYKVIYDTTPPKKMIVFVLPNKGSSADLRTFVVTVDRVEELTGLDFFSAVPKEKQEQMERTITVENWHWIRFPRCGKRRAWRGQTVFPGATTTSIETSATVAALRPRTVPDRLCEMRDWLLFIFL